MLNNDGLNTEAIINELREIKQLLTYSKAVWNMDDFCSYTGISKAQVYHLTSSRKIKFYKPFNKLIFFDSNEVIEFLKQNPIIPEKAIDSAATKYLLKKLSK
jgi:predicted DNA-binding transcriptional regulator AlpA